MSSIDKLNGPELTPREADHILGSFVTEYGNKELRERYEKKYRDSVAVGGNTAKRHKLVYSVLAIAACGLLVVGALSQLNFGNQELDGLLSDYLNVQNSYVSMPRADHTDPFTASILNDFRAERYDLIIERVAADEAGPLKQYYLGLSYLAQKNYGEAKTLLSGIEDNEEYGVDARWYVTLIETKLDGPEEAIELLAAYDPLDGEYYTKAQKILSLMTS